MTSVASLTKFVKTAAKNWNPYKSASLTVSSDRSMSTTRRRRVTLREIFPTLKGTYKCKITCSRVMLTYSKTRSDIPSRSHRNSQLRMSSTSMT